MKSPENTDNTRYSGFTSPAFHGALVTVIAFVALSSNLRRGIAQSRADNIWDNTTNLVMKASYPFSPEDVNEAIKLREEAVSFIRGETDLFENLYRLGAPKRKVIEAIRNLNGFIPTYNPNL